MYELVDLDSCVDATYKKVCGVEAYCSGEQPESDHHEEGVAKIQQRWNELRDLQLKAQKITYHYGE